MLELVERQLAGLSLGAVAAGALLERSSTWG